jgi:hypothetical protein
VNAKAYGLLAVAAVTSAGIAIFVVRPGTTVAQLVDAGVRTDCNRRLSNCTYLVNGVYSERTLPVAACPNADGGRMEIIATQRMIDHVFNIDACRLVVTALNLDPAEEPTVVTPTCACVRLDAGNCRTADGGRNLGRNEMQPGQWSGSDCVPKPCGEVFGIRNWPAACAL